MRYPSRTGFNAVSRAVGLAILSGAAAAADSPSSEVTLDEVMVTAQRRAETLTKVPISVAAFSQEQMDQRGITTIDDLARVTPGITFTRADGRNAGASNIAIRGIASTVSTSTTGIYLNDTPIQTRIIGAGASNFNAFPAVFDLERVEVLRGPQGTLFGSGSMGGTVRFITQTPSLNSYSAYGRAEVSTIDGGGNGYEGGGAFGGPLIEGTLGFRVSGLMRRGAGYVNRVNTDPNPGDPPLAVFDNDPSTPPTILPRRDSIRFVTEKNSNFSETEVATASLLFAPTESFDVTGNFYYQSQSFNDTNMFWRALSDPDENDYNQGAAIGQPSNDKFILPSLTVNWDLGPVALISNTSYFDRDQDATNDYTAFESALWAGFWTFPVGMAAPTTQINTQRGWTQELRIESTNNDSALTWVVGAFWQRYRQESKQFVEDRFLPALFQDVTGAPFALVFGQGLADGRYTFKQDSVIAYDEQLAGFAQVDFRPIDSLTLTVGARYAETKFDATAYYEGPVVGPPVNDTGSVTENPVTPKFGVSYQMTQDNLLYATAAKGFRVGGYNPQVGLPCIPLLASLGYAPSPGNPTGRPGTYDSDSLWSYEIGSKNVIGNGRAQLSASVYHIDWSNIQQGVGLASCGFAFTTNLGKAESQGFDLEGSLRVGSGLMLGTAIGYNKARFKETVYGGPAATVPLVSDGDAIPGAPWTVTFNGQYDFAFAQRDAYVRFDYEYRSQGPANTSGLNTDNRSPVLPPLDPEVAVRAPSTSILGLRAGMRFGGADVSVFARNVLNENPFVVRGDLSFGGPPHGYTAQTVIPRSYGVTATYRY